MCGWAPGSAVTALVELNRRFGSEPCPAVKGRASSTSSWMRSLWSNEGWMLMVVDMPVGRASVRFLTHRVDGPPVKN